MPRTLPAQPLRIGDYLLIASRHELHDSAGKLQRLPRRLVLLLLELAEFPGAVIGRDALLDRVWQRREVSDEVLSRAIADLRQAFADDARAPRYIETIPKTGYRLLATVQALTEEPTPRDTAATEPVPTESALPPPDRPEPTEPIPLDAAGSVRTPARRFRKLLWVLPALLLVALWLRWPEERVERTHAALPAPSDPLPSTSQLIRSTPLTSDADWEMDPALSADGQWLAYARSAAFGKQCNLLLRHLSKPIERIIADQPGWNDGPAFSPAGDRLAYRHCAVDGPCELRIVGLDGSPWRALGTISAETVGLDWSSAGIVISQPPAKSGRATGISLLDPASGQVRLLTEPTVAEGPDLLPRFVPASRRVVYARGPAGLQQLRWLELDDMNAGGVFALPQSRIQDHRWLDPQHAVIASDAAGFRALVALGGGHWRLLGARGASSLALHPDGGLVYALSEYDADLWLDSLSSKAASVRLDISNRYESQPALSEDGRWLAFTSLREGTDQVWLRELGGAQSLRRVESPPGVQAVRPAFSADSKRLYFSLYQGESTFAYEYELATGRSRQLTGLGDQAFAVQPSADGQWLVFGQHTAAGLKLFRAHADGSAQSAVAGASEVAEFRVKGQQLWWQTRGARRLQCLDLDADTTCEVAMPEQFNSSDLHWDVADQQLIVMATDASLWRHPAAAMGDWIRLGGLGELVGGPAMAVDPEHDRVVSARLQRLAIDLQRAPGK